MTGPARPCGYGVLLQAAAAVTAFAVWCVLIYRIADALASNIRR